jgi:AraC family transcriptional regulator, transcriptional activator of pobA
MSKQQQIPSVGPEFLGKNINFTMKSLRQMARSELGEQGLPHRHNYYTVFWLKAGQGTHYVDFKGYSLRPHTIFLISPGQVHFVEAEEVPDGTAILFTSDFLLTNAITPDFITNLNLFMDAGESPPINVPDDSAARINGLIKTMYAELDSEELLNHVVIGIQLKLFLVECYRLRNHQLPQSHREGSVGYLIVKRFKDLVEENYHNQHRVNEYAEKMNISPNHLNNVIKQHLGTTAKEYLLKRILLEAKKLAYFTDLSLKEITFDLGFDDPSYFSKVFKKLHGIRFSDFKDSI